MEDSFQNEFRNTLSRLDENQKLRLLDFAKSLEKKRKVKNNVILLKFAGSIPKKELILMEKAIEKGCEKIDENEW